ncbi:MAG: LytTR family DNA-binding domain-containing protein [Alphaproteobacteria bacterium]|nr:LytTR family DNA-binding domain-containing protein [Alphaproteobacteria bacterium]MBU1517211.1 LytTR family DNA-binding domain-containing protein [Alphaproteobacteria bacterium]MBU2093253.1 LytTR family DNA-binding domain-containing protein [Alphaproteobacteria bacterium]MBU2153121.1 LytTR family DNA-binding domain-containing protein [Alphaproteobacteria bacterium]MBU2307827.1 LytTR family DNA-binding domain-containing protein [Alphaproteobacteria bacterium]
MTPTPRVLTVDDEVLALRRMELLLRRMPEVELVGQARSGTEALEAIAQLRPNVVLLDIRMADMSGLDVAETLTGPEAPMVIFVTAFDEFAVRAFELSALDYVVKPVEFGRLRRAVNRARARLEAKEARAQAAELRGVVAALRADRDPAAPPNELWVQRRGEYLRVLVDDIDWVEAERDYVHVHARGERYLMRQTLTGIQARLGARRFVRIRRSALVRADGVHAIRKAGYGDVRVKLTCGEELRVGRTYVTKIRALLSPRGEI